MSTKTTNTGTTPASTASSSQSLPSTSKAWLLKGFNQPYELCDIPTPTLDDPHDILIRVTAASYCHTDALVAQGIVPPLPPLPHIGCHEYAGVVVALPADSTKATHGFKVGDHVAVPGCGNHVCGSCLECDDDSAVLPDAKGYSVYCPNSGAGLGVDRPGGFREYAVVDGRQIGRVPEGLKDVDVAPLMCAGLTIYTAIRKLNLKKGQRIAILGCGGGLGHLGLQFAARMGLKVLGIDINDRALELARSLDLPTDSVQILDGKDEKNGAEQLRKVMGQQDGRKYFDQMGVDAAIILPESQKAFDLGCALTRNGGKIMVLSFPPEGFHFSAFDVVIRRLSVEGSLIGSNRAMEEMFEFCVQHGVRAKLTTYAFDDLNQLVEDYHKGTPGKLVIDVEKGR
jgi:D-arabinose 1-dehydrogenase-like Zn-dependent alcohol dehydrogenase